MAAPTCATSLAVGPSRSSRAISDACSVAGTAGTVARLARARFRRCRPPAPPWSAPRRIAAPRPLARRSLSQHRSAALQRRRPGGPAWRLARRSSRLRTRTVTCACPVHGGWNSGRKVIKSRTGRRATRSTSRSSSSRELGSIQCTSSKIISTGRCRAKASSCRSSASKVFSFCAGA